MDHFRSDYAARHSIQTWKNVGVDFLNLSQFILQWHYVWCSDLNLVYKALHGFMDHLVNPPVHHSPCRTQSENMVVPGPSWLWSGFSANGRPWSDLPWHLSMSNFWFFLNSCPRTLSILCPYPSIPGCEFGFLLRIYRFYVWCEITWFVQMKMKRAKMQRRTHTP